MHSTPNSEAPATRTTRAVLRPAVSPPPETFSSPMRAELAWWMMGVSSRVGTVQAYGNAIDPWAAAEAMHSLS